MGFRLTKIYTRTGDTGSTGLGSGDRVAKYSPRVDCYGETDELSSHIGVLVTLTTNPELLRQLEDIQHRLFDIGGELSLPGVVSLDDQPITNLEEWLDLMNEALEPLSNFILPGGSPAAAQAHVCRTVARRAERRLCEFAATNHGEEEVNPNSIAYLNRLSDYLFVLARHLNKLSEVNDTLWKTAEQLKKPNV